jgi:hypothetical protein
VTLPCRVRRQSFSPGGSGSSGSPLSPPRLEDRDDPRVLVLQEPLRRSRPRGPRGRPITMRRVRSFDGWLIRRKKAPISAGVDWRLGGRGLGLQ